MTSIIPNVIAGEFVENYSGDTFDVTNPADNSVIGKIPLSDKSALDAAVAAAKTAQVSWAATPVKDRVQVMFNLKRLIEERRDDLAKTVVEENGKTTEEAIGSVMRALECVEYASSLPQLMPGQVMGVSPGVECKTQREPLGVVAGITPFNFPFMVPLWMLPMALSTGNAFILKPSEQTPISAVKLATLLKDAGLPDGLFSVVHGDKNIVEGICDHPDIKGIGFVGSTTVAKLVYERGTSQGKRVRSLGGAKNHLVLVPDADPEMAATNVMASVTGCAGQRCMAASVLLAVGDVDHIIDKIKEKMAAIVPGKDMGPIISRKSFERITSYLDKATEGNATLLLDGRGKTGEGSADGNYMGASIIDNATPSHTSACDEIFGPVLTIIRCKTLDEALAIENDNPYGNAAAIYTSSGRVATEFTDRANAGMIGVNIGVPVPREPFAFGGWNDSAFGDGDITGNGAIDFWTRTKKVTTKWEAKFKSNWMS